MNWKDEKNIENNVSVFIVYSNLFTGNIDIRQHTWQNAFSKNINEQKV